MDTITRQTAHRVMTGDGRALRQRLRVLDRQLIRMLQVRRRLASVLYSAAVAEWITEDRALFTRYADALGTELGVAQADLLRRAAWRHRRV